MSIKEIYYFVRTLEFLLNLADKKRLLGLVYQLFRKSRFGYLGQLKSQIKEMPFIYKDDSILSEAFTIKNFYAEPIIGYCPVAANMSNDISSFKNKDSNPYVQDLGRVGANILKECSSSIIFGMAGIGKTTFLSHTILNIINKKKTLWDFYPFDLDKKYIPVFIPLKVLDYELSNPIVRYIFSIPYFRGKKGRKRFIRLCKNKSILLFLDGYDEIYIEDGNNNIIEELNILFSRKPLDSNSGINDIDLFSTYKLLCYTKKWLSSRYYFYTTNPLKAIEEDKFVLEKNLQFYNTIADLNAEIQEGELIDYQIVGSVMINGIHNPKSLIKRYVEMYYKKDKSLISRINEDDFWDFLESKIDSKLKELIKNPLFLTIFFYIFAQTKISDEESNIHIEKGIDVKLLIERCTSLMLSDLDKFKIRSETNRNIKERLKYREEKFSFLKYFAAQFLLSDELKKKKIFTKDQLINCAKIFFKNNHQILRQLEKGNSHNIVESLLKQDLFIIVDWLSDEKKFDFPHRRFPEILAVGYFNDEENFEIIKDNIENPNYREFIIAYFSASNKNQDKLLSIFADKILKRQSEELFIILLDECLQNKPLKLDIDNSLIEKVFLFLVFEKKVDIIPESITNNYKLTEDAKLSYYWELDKTIKKQNFADAKRLFNILKVLNKKCLKAYVNTNLKKGNSHKAKALEFLADYKKRELNRP